MFKKSLSTQISYMCSTPSYFDYTDMQWSSPWLTLLVSKTTVNLNLSYPVWTIFPVPQAQKTLFKSSNEVGFLKTHKHSHILRKNLVKTHGKWSKITNWSMPWTKTVNIFEIILLYQFKRVCFEKRGWLDRLKGDPIRRMQSQKRWNRGARCKQD